MENMMDSLTPPNFTYMGCVGLVTTREIHSIKLWNGGWSGKQMISLIKSFSLTR